MFVYFPEFVYKFSKNFVKTTLDFNFDKTNCERILSETMKLEEVSETIKAFNKAKIKLPITEFKHCLQTDFIKPISNYDPVENKIEICKNLISNEQELRGVFIKELTYAQEFNINFAKKNLTLNDLAKISSKACSKSLTIFKEIKYSKNLHVELTKRCAYNDFKYKFAYELTENLQNLTTNEDLTINELVKNLIDRNNAL